MGARQAARRKVQSGRQPGSPYAAAGGRAVDRWFVTGSSLIMVSWLVAATRNAGVLPASRSCPRLPNPRAPWPWRPLERERGRARASRATSIL